MGSAMAGSMRQRGNDSWQLRVHAGRDPFTGRKRYEARTLAAQSWLAIPSKVGVLGVSASNERRFAAFSHGSDAFGPVVRTHQSILLFSLPDQGRAHLICEMTTHCLSD